METQIVHLYIFDTLADWEPALAVAGLNNPAFQAQPGRFRVRTAGETRTPVVTQGGLTLLPDMTLAEVEPERSALLILPGGDWSEGKHLEAIAKAREFLSAGVPVAAICGATEGLARAGLLDDKRHTSNAPEYLRKTHYRGADLYQQQGAVTDGDLITAGAPFPIEFAYEIFQKLAVYDEATLAAWYARYRTGDSTAFYRGSSTGK